MPLQRNPGPAAAGAFIVKLVQEYCTKQPMTKRVPRAVHTQCYKQSQLLHSHYLQNVGRESLNMPSWPISSLPTDPMDCSMPGLPVSHHLPEFTQVHVHELSQ